MRDFRSLFVLGSLLVATACGPADRDENNNGNPDGGNNPTGDGSSSDDCSEEAKLIYTVDENNTLAQYDPVTKQFTDLGPLQCPAEFLASPFSMGVDRNAVAYVLYSSGELFRVDTKTLQCTATTWGSPNGMLQFGMGFSTDTAGGTTDTLFIAGGSNPAAGSVALNRVDVNTMQATPLGTITGSPELTGTGNAELWGFFPTTPGSNTVPRIDRIEKTNGSSSISFPLNALQGEPLAWAFAFFGGDFHVFLMRDTDAATIVYQIDGATGAVEGMTNTQGRTIVGAGVSTCAPVILL